MDHAEDVAKKLSPLRGYTFKKFGEHFFMIFSKAKEDRKRMELYITLYCYMQEILNDTGMKALESGRFAYFFNEEARERYRNPPAHTRYVTLTIANECRSFVEGVVREMNFYFK